jgi:hypothetical protein
VDASSPWRSPVRAGDAGIYVLLPTKDPASPDISSSARIVARTRAMFRPTRESASSQPNNPNRSNSGSDALPRSKRLAHRSVARSGKAVRRHSNRARSLPGRYRWMPSVTNEPGAALSPVSFCNSRDAADAKSSPGAAIPFGISQRGERVAWPSKTRVPSVTSTPQLTAFMTDRHRKSGSGGTPP